MSEPLSHLCEVRPCREKACGLGLFARRAFRSGAVLFKERAVVWREVPEKANQELGQDQLLVELTDLALQLELDADALATQHALPAPPPAPTAVWYPKTRDALQRLHSEKALPLAHTLRHYRVAHYRMWNDAWCGSGVYKRISFMNHACVPNCVVLPLCDADGTLMVVAQQDIHIGDELTYAYVQAMEATPLTWRPALLPQTLGFVCHCQLCMAFARDPAMQQRTDEKDPRYYLMVTHPDRQETAEFLKRIQTMVGTRHQIDDALLQLTRWMHHYLFEVEDEREDEHFFHLTLALAPFVARLVMQCTLSREQMLQEVYQVWGPAMVRAATAPPVLGRVEFYRQLYLLMALAYFVADGTDDNNDKVPPRLLFELSRLLATLSTEYVAREAQALPRLKRTLEVLSRAHGNPSPSS